MGDGEVLALADMESTLGYHPLFIGPLTEEVTTLRTVSGGQFDWGGRLPKGNGGAQRSPQPGWQPGVECNRTRGLDCETGGSSRDESRR